MLVAAGVLLIAAPSFAQTVGHLPARRRRATMSQPVWVLFDLGSSHAAARRQAGDRRGGQATAKARQVDQGLPGRPDRQAGRQGTTTRSWRSERSLAVATELIRAGYPAKNVVIATNPEAFGNMSLGSNDASEKDRKRARSSRANSR